MPQPRRPTGGATTEKQIPSLANSGYFSDYYLAHRLDAGLSDLYARWNELDKQGEPNERTRVRNLTVAVRHLSRRRRPHRSGRRPARRRHARPGRPARRRQSRAARAERRDPHRARLDAGPRRRTADAHLRREDGHRARRPYRNDADRRAACRARHRLRDRPGRGHRDARRRPPADSSNRFCSTTSRPPAPPSKRRS